MALNGKGRTLLYLFLIWLVYLTIGVFIFRAIEHDGDVEHDSDEEPEKTKEQLLEKLKLDLTVKYNMSETEFNNILQIVQQIETASPSNGSGPEWSYHESLSFVIQLVTTIGYGNITPMTKGGRVLCIFYALFGIPINILFLQLIGEIMLNGEKQLVTKFETRCLKREGLPKYLNEKCSLLGFLLLVLMLVICARTQMHIDGWTFLEGFYCFFITFTTVGFGDFIPGNSPTTKSPANTAVRVTFIVLGLAAMSNVINGLASCTECGLWFKRLKARCGRRNSADISETKKGDGLELNE